MRIFEQFSAHRKGSLLVAAMLVIAACGDDDERGDVTTSTEPLPPTTTEITIEDDGDDEAACDRFDTGVLGVLADYTLEVELTSTGAPVAVDLNDHVTVPDSVVRPCIIVEPRRPAPAGTYLGEFDLDGTVLTFTPPTPTPGEPSWGRTSIRFCIEELQTVSIKGCSHVTVRLLSPQVARISRMLDRISLEDGTFITDRLLTHGGEIPSELLPSISSADSARSMAVLLDDLQREVMLTAGTSPAGVAAIQAAWDAAYQALTVELFAKIPFTMYVGWGCGGLAGAVAAMYSMTLDVLGLLELTMDVSMAEIDAMRGIDPLDTLGEQAERVVTDVDAVFAGFDITMGRIDELGWRTIGAGMATSAICDALYEVIQDHAFDLAGTGAG